LNPLDFQEQPSKNNPKISVSHPNGLYFREISKRARALQWDPMS
jgi:hypothetical protein